jgi:nucleotide-binding universal stress UspA family protein
VIDAQQTFDRIVAGVDGSTESVEACRQAARLVNRDGLLEVVSVFDSAPAAGPTGWNAPRVADEHEGTARAALTLARLVVGDVGETALIDGDPTRSLLRELARLQATLAVIGAYGHSRVSQAVLGSVAWELLQRAPCSVLVVRPSQHDESTPEQIVVGLDDSPCSERALAVGRFLEGRFGASLQVVTASAGHEIDLDRVRLKAPTALIVDGEAVGVLVAAAETADLLILGHNGHRDLDTLTSISERVAHRATSSVLLVR